jgi:RNA polymerase sigma-70 factor (ECF subfamily)
VSLAKLVQNGAKVQTVDSDSELVETLKRGDEMAFEALITQHYALMIRIATNYVQDNRLAEDVVQETWIAVLRGLDKFEGRSAFKTWLFSILINKAKTFARREHRHDHSSLEEDHTTSTGDASVPAHRFHPPDTEKAGHWVTKPDSWQDMPEANFLSQEVLDYIRQFISNLPGRQREVITLRDIEGWNSSEVCNLLEISETNQRVLLHRARSNVREALEAYLKEE